jgi:hypothetical protein
MENQQKSLIELVSVLLGIIKAGGGYQVNEDEADQDFRTDGDD